MPRVSIWIPPEHADTLAALAAAERRNPKAQAGLLLERILAEMSLDHPVLSTTTERRRT